MNRLISFLEAVYPLSRGVKKELARRLQVQIFNRQEYLLKAGRVSKNIFFIEEGLVRCYYKVRNREVSSWFMKEGDVVISVNSFFLQVPSFESIQAIEPTTVQFIQHEELEFLYKTFHSFNIHGRKILTHYYCQSEDRLNSLRIMRARDRFDWLLRNEPTLFQRVPRKFLASYLGYSESTLSRIYNYRYRQSKY